MWERRGTVVRGVEVKRVALVGREFADPPPSRSGTSFDSSQEELAVALPRRVVRVPEEDVGAPPAADRLDGDDDGRVRSLAHDAPPRVARTAESTRLSLRGFVPCLKCARSPGLELLVLPG